MTKMRPPITVVIPSYSGQHLLEQHLPDVIKQLHSGDEVIVVDDASPAPDTTVDWVAQQAEKYAPKGIELRCIRHETNQRFAAAVNTGVQAARHQYVWLLNNDVTPLSANGPEQLLEHFPRDIHLFAVGCLEVTSEKVNAPRAGRGTGNFRRGLLVHWYDPDQDDPKTLWTAGGSMALDRDKFMQLGGMDVRFAPAYEEDRDLSYRALKRGWNLIHDPDVVVLHQHETTNQSVLGRRGMAISSWKNQFLLVWKNITDLGLTLQHLLWLPYHLTVSNWRERGAVLEGFLWALRWLPAMVVARQQESAQQARSDREVLDMFGSQPPEAA